MTKLKFLPTLGLIALLSTTAFAWEKDKPATPPVIPPNPDNLPKVLLIGDSISGGYHKSVAKALEGKAVVAKSSDNGESTTVGVLKIDGWLGDTKWDAIHFNWGVWDMYGWQYAADDRSPAAYAQRLQILVARMKKTGAKLIWATTTPVPPKAEATMLKRWKQEVVIDEKLELEYRDAALQVMKKHGVTVNDLYALLKPRRSEFQKDDNVHFSPAGSALMAAQVAQTILGSLVKNAPSAEPKEAREQRIQWWREARFGLFIHWGLYAIPGGTWKDKTHATGYSEWIMFGEKIPANEYEKLAAKFNPAKFDAKAWAGIAKKAGMKYMVLTTKHHDGFSMFQSSLTPYNVADATPFKRDVTRELVDACRDSGLRFGCYYSIDRDWYRPQGPGNNYKQANVWDFPDSKREDFDRYFTTFAKPQVEELLTKYRPDLLWFDEIDMKTDAQVEDLYQSIRKLRPECVINSRIQGCRFPAKIPPPHCDYISTGDNEIADKNLGFEWENPGSMNTSYGFSANDHNWVSAAEIISRLVEIVSKGGNYLLNVGPTPEGLIPQPCIERLAKVGEWMKVNGEAIYGTSASVFGNASAATAANWRCTTKPGKIYLHLFNWPATGTFELPGLESKVKQAYLLAGGKKLKVKSTSAGVTLTLPPEAPDKIASVICLEIADQIARVAAQK